MSRVFFPVSDVVPGCKANSTKLAEFLAKKQGNRGREDCKCEKNDSCFEDVYGGKNVLFFQL